MPFQEYNPKFIFKRSQQLIEVAAQMVNKDEYYWHVLCALDNTAAPLVTRDFLWVLGTRQHHKAPENVEVEDSN